MLSYREIGKSLLRLLRNNRQIKLIENFYRRHLSRRRLPGHAALRLHDSRAEGSGALHTERLLSTPNGIHPVLCVAVFHLTIPLTVDLSGCTTTLHVTTGGCGRRRISPYVGPRRAAAGVSRAASQREVVAHLVEPRGKN